MPKYKMAAPCAGVCRNLALCVAVIGWTNMVFGGISTNSATADQGSFAKRQSTGAEAASLPTANTLGINVNITAPTNGASFTTNQAFTFDAAATATHGIQELALYTNSVLPANLVATAASTNISIVLSNLPPGSYPLIAVATDNTGFSVTSTMVHVTINAPGTTLIDFDLLDASAGPVSGTTLSNYLAGYGVTVGAVTWNTTLAVEEDLNIFDGTLTVAYSPPNFLTQTGAYGAASYTLLFNQPYTSVSWVRTELLASYGGAVSPAWMAYAYDVNQNEVSQVGEARIFSSDNIAAQTFTLSGSNIASVTFVADNNIGDLNTLTLDNLLLSTGAPGPAPQITLTACNVVSVEPGGINLSAQASENGGTISSIEFYENENLVGLPAMVNNGTNSTASLSVTSLAPGAYTFYAVATDANGIVAASTNITLTVAAVPGGAVINFDDPVLLNTSLGAVGGTNLSDYLAGFGITISNKTVGTRLEAINQNSYSGNEIPMPSSLPNLFTQVGSRLPVTFSLSFATNLQSVSFTRVALLTNGPSAISHPAWSAQILDTNGNELESVSEPLLFSSNNIPSRNFTLAGTNIATLRFDSDSEQTAAFAAVLLDDLVIDTNAVANPLSISLASSGGPFTAPASIVLSPNVVDGFGANYYVAFYSGPTLIGTNSGQNSPFTWTNVLNGTFNLTAMLMDASGYALPSAPVTVTVAPGGSSLVVNFDALNASNGPVAGPNLASYLAANGGISVVSNSPGTRVAVENEANVAGGGFVSLSSVPNLLTQIGSNGPISFTMSFSNLLAQFSFTRPELLANPSVTHPAWQASIFDPLGNLLDSVQEPLIFSYTNVPAQTYTLTGGSIARVEFSSDGTGLATFNAALLDDFVLTSGNASNLPPSVLITNPMPGRIFLSAAIPITAETAGGGGTVTSVNFYFAGTNLAGSAQTSPFSILWNAPSNGSYILTAVVFNNAGLSSTSAPVAITVSTGFAILSPPASRTIALGASDVFTVTTTLRNRVSYQWQTNGVAIPGATLSSYAITNAPLSAAGSYTVVAKADGLSVTSQPPAVLTVLSPPSISTTSPLQPVVNIGDTVTMSVNASDAVPFYYQWKLNGTRIPGATNSSYTISNVQPLNSGRYRVVAANIVASSDSPIFNVAVDFGGTPSTTNAYFDSSIPMDPLVSPMEGINSNSPAAGELGEIAGKPAGNFLWYNWTAGFTGVISLTTLGSSFDTLLGVYTGTNVANLIFLAEDDDSGGFFTSLVTFNCVQGTTYQIAVAGYKGATGMIVLGLPTGTGYRVLDPTSGDIVPVITQEPSNQIVQAGADVTLSVTASNATDYQWYFAGAPVVGISATTLLNTNTLLSTNTLVIRNFPAAAVGNYYVLAINSVGAAQSATALIEIAGENNNGATNVPNRLTVDKFGDAVDLTGTASPAHSRPKDNGGDTGNFTLSQSFSTVGGTKEEGEPNHAGQPGGASYWYSYTAPGNASIVFDTAGSTFNTILAVYTGPGDSFSTLVNVGAAYTTNYLQQGQPVVLVSNVTAGTQYYIAIDGYLGASGAAHLDVVLNLASNAFNTNVPPLTNSFPGFAMDFPPNNYLTTSSNLIIQGTVSGIPGAHEPLLSFVQIAVNTNDFGEAALDATNYVVVFAPLPGGQEEAVPEETVTWSSNVTLLPGPNVITAQSIGVLASGIENASLALTRTVFYVAARPLPLVKSTLTLATNGDGKITGLANQASFEVNKIFTVTAVPIGNWVFANWNSGTNINSLSPLPNGPSLSFVMSSNLVLQANFVTNPFTGIDGVYSGLFSPAGGVTEESSGFITAAIPAASRGAYTARLLLDGGSYPFSGTFDLSGNAEQTIVRPGKTPVTVYLQLNLAAPDDQMTGNVNEDVTNGWISTILADRAAFDARRNPATNYAGRYTLIIPPSGIPLTNEPGGYGYATLTNNLAGNVAISGRLADGAAISQSVAISKDGNIPLYVSLYSRQGSLLGWLTLTNNPSNNPAQTILGANLSWIKNPGKAGTLYDGGFTNVNLAAFGSLYIPPQTGGNVLSLTNGTLTLSNANLGGSLIYSNLTVAGNKLVNNGPGTLSGVIAPASGVLTLTFRAAGANADLEAKGVILQGDSPTNAAGWFLDAGQSGFFLLQQ